MEKNCQRCHKDFLTNKPWATLCSDCFKATMRKLQCEHCGDFFWTEKYRPDMWPCKNCKDDLLVHLINRPPVVVRQSSLNKDLLKDLIFLSHPDKHGNSEKATRATQQLLTMRTKQEVALWESITLSTKLLKGHYELVTRKLCYSHLRWWFSQC